MEVQSFFATNTHYSPSHALHGHTPVATQWFLAVPDADRASGYRAVRDLGHTNYYGQTTLPMFERGGLRSPSDRR